MTTINKDKYKFEKYNPIYKILFQKEKAKLIKIFPKSQIEHVGSTSVPDLGGKGIIDIAISAPKNQINNSIKKLWKKPRLNNLNFPFIIFNCLSHTTKRNNFCWLNFSIRYINLGFWRIIY